jgi:hypothetical protein
MASKDDEFLAMKLLRTPAGQEVLQAFINELFTTSDLASSIERGREEAKRKILVPFEISLIIDYRFFDRFLGLLRMTQYGVRGVKSSTLPVNIKFRGQLLSQE